MREKVSKNLGKRIYSHPEIRLPTTLEQLLWVWVAIGKGQVTFEQQKKNHNCNPLQIRCQPFMFHVSLLSKDNLVRFWNMFGLQLCTGKTEQVPSSYNRERLSKSFPHTAALMNTWLLEFLCMTDRRSISQSPAWVGGEELLCRSTPVCGGDLAVSVF